MTHTTVTIRPARAVDLADIGIVAAAALHRDPIGKLLAPDLHERRAILDAYFTILAGHAYTHGGAVDIVPGRACAIWIPSSALPDLSRDRLRAACRTTATAFTRLTGPFDHVRPDEPHDYLALLAVAPAIVGTGVGSALLRRHATTLTARVRAAYAEAATPTSRRLRGYGFQPRGRAIDLGTGPIQPMWRPAVPMRP